MLLSPSPTHLPLLPPFLTDRRSSRNRAHNPPPPLYFSTSQRPQAVCFVPCIFPLPMDTRNAKYAPRYILNPVIHPVSPPLILGHDSPQFVSSAFAAPKDATNFFRPTTFRPRNTRFICTERYLEPEYRAIHSTPRSIISRGNQTEPASTRRCFRPLCLQYFPYCYPPDRPPPSKQKNLTRPSSPPSRSSRTGHNQAWCSEGQEPRSNLNSGGDVSLASASTNIPHHSVLRTPCTTTRF